MESLRKSEEWLLFRLGQMLKEQTKLAKHRRDQEQIALIKKVMQMVREQRKVKPGPGYGRRNGK